MAAVAVLTVAGCSTPRTDPNPAEEKYTLQSFLISTPTDDFNQVFTAYLSSASTTVSGFVSADGTPIPAQPTPVESTPSQELVDTLLKNPDNEIIEFPLAYVEVGATVTNAQTEVLHSIVDASVVEGKVVYEKEPIHVGPSVILTINEILESGAINCNLEIDHCRLTGVEHYTLEEEFEIEMPHYEKRSINTEITLAPNSWLPMAGMISQRNDGTKVHEIFLIRLLPPK